MQKGIKPAQWCSKNTGDCWISIHQCHKCVEKMYTHHLVYYRVPNLNKSILFNEKSTQDKQQISKYSIYFQLWWMFLWMEIKNDLNQWKSMQHKQQISKFVLYIAENIQYIFSNDECSSRWKLNMIWNIGRNFTYWID